MLLNESHQMKALTGQGEPVLYLDFDGVLHPEDVLWDPHRGAVMNVPGHQLFEHGPILEQLLAGFPQIKIVLSTSWVRQYGFSGAAKRLGPMLRQRCVGATFHTAMRPTEWSFARLPRALQVLEDVRRRQPGGWVAIDDDHGDWPAQFEARLVRSNPTLGLSAPDVLEELRAKLWAMTAP